MAEHFSAIETNTSVDRLGNVICRISSGLDNPKKLMVFAHADELGFIFHKIEPNMFLRMTRV